MTDLVLGHLSARVPGTTDQFLINPYPRLFEPSTASTLVKVNAAGDVLFDVGYTYDIPAYTTHGAVYEARLDAGSAANASTLRRDAGAALGDGYALLVRGRGLLVCGNTLTQTWKLLFFLDKCCRSQIAAMAAAHAAGTPLTVPSDAVVTHAVAQSRGFVEHPRYIAD